MVALKVLNLNDHISLDAIAHELNIHSFISKVLPSKHNLRLIGSFQNTGSTTERAIIILELAAGGDLYSRLENRATQSFNQQETIEFLGKLV